MSARDNLLQICTDWQTNCGQYAFSEERMKSAIEHSNEWVDAFAHELAEEIRNSEWLRDLTDDHMHDCIAAADLIDPGVEN